MREWWCLYRKRRRWGNIIFLVWEHEIPVLLRNFGSGKFTWVFKWYIHGVMDREYLKQRKQSFAGDFEGDEFCVVWNINWDKRGNFFLLLLICYFYFLRSEEQGSMIKAVRNYVAGVNLYFQEWYQYNRELVTPKKTVSKHVNTKFPSLYQSLKPVHQHQNQQQ